MDLINASLEYFSIRKTDDYTLNSVDRLSSKWMGIWIVICLVLSTAEPYVGRPIECWPNDEFEKYSAYMLEYCYLNNTRYVYPGDSSHELKKSKPITYYQWTNLILICLLAIYITPTLILVAVVRNFDISPQKLAEASLKYNISAKKDQREQCVTEITSSVLSYLSHHKYNRFTYTYLSTKLLNVIFNILAIVFLCVVFGKGYLFFSLKFIHQVIVENTLVNDVFPLETFCDFRLIIPRSEQSKDTDVTVQCLLSTNLFLIFIFASMNIIQLVVLISTIVDFFLMLQKMTYRGRLEFLQQQLRGSPYTYNFHSALDVLSLDGILILRLLSSNVNMMVVSEVIKHICLVDDRTRIGKMPEEPTEVELDNLSDNKEEVQHAANNE